MIMPCKLANTTGCFWTFISPGRENQRQREGRVGPLHPYQSWIRMRALSHHPAGCLGLGGSLVLCEVVVWVWLQSGGVTASQMWQRERPPTCVKAEWSTDAGSGPVVFRGDVFILSWEGFRILSWAGLLQVLKRRTISSFMTISKRFKYLYKATCIYNICKHHV